MSTEIFEQAELEIQALAQVGDALRAALAWQVQGAHLQRKLSTVRFLTQSYQRYLERLFAVEEHDGYMDVALQSSPQLESKIKKLQQDHDQLRQQIRRLSTQLDHLAPKEEAAFETLGDSLTHLIDDVDKHHAREIGVVQEAFTQDVGGES
jgi:hemerythrin-like domain-containing protein